MGGDDVRVSYYWSSCQYLQTLLLMLLFFCSVLTLVLWVEFSPAIAFANHEGASGVYSAKFGQVVTCNQDLTFVYVGIPGFRTTNLNDMHCI